MKPKASAKILLVEDDVFLMRVYNSALAEGGFDVRGAMEASEVLDEAKTYKPALILLDTMLHDDDGLSVLKRLKEDRATAAIPVVMMASYGHPSEREQSLIHGAVDYWVKLHYEPAEIAELVRILLTKK